MIEFQLYNRIANGDLRPNLEVFKNDEGLDSLEQEFYTKSVTITDDTLESIFADFDHDFHGFKPGDRFMLNISEDAENPKMTIERIPNPDEEELISIDIPPPIDRKTEIFHRIIEDEYNRLKVAFVKKMENTNDIVELQIYTLKNIQIAKKLSQDAYRLEKKFKKDGVDDWHNPNTLVMYSLKRHLIYSLLTLQELLYPIINLKPQHEFELEDELFDFSHSKRRRRSKIIHKDLAKKHLERIYKELDDKVTFEEKRQFFIEKINDQDKEISKSGKSEYGVPKYLLDFRNLYLKELGEILDDFYTRTLITNSKDIGILKKYETIVKTVAELKVQSKSLETISLKETDFFSKVEIEINSLKRLIDISSVTPIAENILKDLISFLLMLQSRRHLKLSENQWNDYLSDLLRVKNYYVSDQSRNGDSGTKDQNPNASGELDISIRDSNNNGIIKAIIESFVLSSCGKKNKTVGNHINKLLNRYDTSGNKENYLIIFSKANSFNGLWEKYISHINQLSLFENSEPELMEVEDLVKSDIRVARNIIQREKKELKLYHLFVNMNKN